MAYNVLTQEDARNKFISIFKEKVIPVRKGADQLLAWIEQTSRRLRQRAFMVRLKADCAITALLFMSNCCASIRRGASILPKPRWHLLLCVMT